jgi:hypothetical protein
MYVGLTDNITWSFVDVLSGVKIELSRDNGTTWELVIADTPNTGSYLWVVTGPVTSSGLIRISGLIYTDPDDNSQIDFTDIVSISSTPFTIAYTTPGVFTKICDRLSAESQLSVLYVAQDGRLYAGTQAHGYLWRLLLDESGWEQICPQLGTVLRITRLLDWNGWLVGAGAGGTTQGSSLLRVNDAGNAWQVVAAKYLTEATIQYLNVYQSRLYGMTASGKLLRLNVTNDAWELISSGSSAGSINAEVFQNHYYWGSSSGNLLKLNDTFDGSDVVVVGPPPGALRVQSLCTFKDQLYVTTSNNSSLFKMNATKDGLIPILPQYGSYTVINIAVYNNRLYGLVGLTGPGILIRLNESETAWEQVCAQYGSETTQPSFAVFNNKFYLGTSASAVLLQLPVHSTNTFNPTPQRDSTVVTSVIDPTDILARITNDSYFTAANQISRIDVTYTANGNRQKKVITHLPDSSSNFSGPISWTSDSTAGTWQKTKIKVQDTDGAVNFLNRNIIGPNEDLTLS